jgi:hypothetical protein
MGNTTLKMAQAAIDKRDIPVTLERGTGYHYVIYDSAREKVYDTESTMICYTSDLSPKEWADEAERLWEIIKARLISIGTM